MGLLNASIRRRVGVMAAGPVAIRQSEDDPIVGAVVVTRSPRPQSVTRNAAASNKASKFFGRRQAPIVAFVSAGAYSGD